MYDTQHTKTLNKQMGVISFIIPCYNIPIEMLKECIESILVLSLRPDEREIIIVDDGSEQPVIEKLSPYYDDIIYIRQKNKGTSIARNTGISVSTGDYIQFIDADDKLIQAPYEHCLDIIRYHHADVVCFHAGEEHESSVDFKCEKTVDGSTYMRHNNINGSVCCYLFDRKTMGQLRFRANTYHEDEEFTPQLLLRAENVYATNAKAYYYRSRAESRMHKHGIKHTLQRLQDNEKVIENIRKMASTGPEGDREALQRRVAQLTMDYLYNIIVETRSFHYLERSVDRLHQKGLFPLPDKNYTTKYRWFRTLSNTKLGRRLLCRILPKLKK